jgi:hypothetical protein
VLLWNERGEVTEATTANLVVVLVAAVVALGLLVLAWQGM